MRWACFLLALSVPAATITGSVLDPSRAVVPGVTLLLKYSGKAQQELARSGADGGFRFEGIQPGSYELEVRAAGFVMATKPMTIQADSDAITSDISLALGSINETIRVTGKGPVRIPEPSSAPKRIRVGGNVQAARLVKQVRPIYPPEAQQAGLEGPVVLRAVISREGGLLSLKPLNTADPVLAKAALDAVSQWQYQPTLLNGVPVEIITTVLVEFRLEN